MQPGALIAQKYRVLRALGEGAMGSVWAAENELTERSFAIKLIHRSHLMAAELRERMLREARACGRLRHKNVVEVYDVGETDEGDPFLVMELLEGETFEALLARRGRLPTVQVAAIGFQVASALCVAHDAGIIHRDLKPANIFLHQDPDVGTVVKVLDFGVSKLLADRNTTTTITGGAVGSPAYMSPEQATAQADIDQRTDLWSVGVLLFEASAGKSAFAGETAFAVVGNILHGPLPDLERAVPGADPRLASIVRRCLVRDPAQRMPSARQLAAELEQLLPRSASAVLRDLEDEPTLSDSGVLSAPSARAAHTVVDLPASSLRSRSLWPVLGASLAVLIALVLVITAIAMRSRPAEPTPGAETASELAASPPETAPVEPVVGPAPSEPLPVAMSSAPLPTTASTKPPVKRSGSRPPAAICPPDKVIFGADGKKRCALAGRRVQ